MWQTSFYLFGSIGIVWSLLWISLYSEKDCERNDEIPLVSIQHVSFSILLMYTISIRRIILLSI